MGMNDFAPFLKRNGCFVVRNITADRQKTIKIFNYPIPFNQTRDILQIPGVSESDIRASLLKGELRNKILSEDIIIECSDIDLLQFNDDQKLFLQNAGVVKGLETSGGGGSSEWKKIGNVVSLSENDDQVAIGSSTVLGAEKLRIIGDVTIDGSITFDSAESIETSTDAITINGKNGVLLQSNDVTALSINSAGDLVTVPNALKVSTLGLGVVHSNGVGLFSSSLIVNADVSSSAAISGTKISPVFGAQSVTTTSGFVGPNLDTSGTTTLSIGETNASGIDLGKTGSTVSAKGAMSIAQDFSVSSLSTGIAHIDADGLFTSSLIVNADISNAAAIDGSKISPSFGSQIVSTTLGVQSPSLDTSSAIALNLGTSNASSISLGKTDITTTNNGNLTVTQATTLSSLGTGIIHSNSSGLLSSSLIVDSDVNAAAAIAGTKISPSFGAQLVSTTTGLQSPSLDTSGATTLSIGITNASGISIGKTGNTVTNNGSLTVAQTVTLSSLGTGIVHSNSSGILSSSLLVDADVSAVAAISGSKISPSFGAQVVSTSSGFTGPSLDTSGATTLSIGTINTSGISVGKSGIVTTNNGSLTITQTATVSSLGTGIVHSNNTGVLSSSLLVDADVSSSAAITGTKISPSFGAQLVSTTTGFQGPYLDTGTASNLSLRRNGSEIISVQSTGISVTGSVTSSTVFLGSAGTAGAPTHSFTGDPDTGLYNVSANVCGVSTNGTVRLQVSDTTLTFTQAASSTDSPNLLVLTGGAHNPLTASTETIDVNVNLARTVTFSTGALTTQRAMLVQAPTYAFSGASTLTNAATFAITGAPVPGTNATITNTWSLWVQGGATRFDGTIECPGAGTNSLRIGSGTTAVGLNAIAIGTNAAADNSDLCIGSGSSITGGASQTVVVGHGINTSSSSGTTIGYNAVNYSSGVSVGQGANCGSSGVAVGRQSGGGAGASNSVSVGNNASAGGTNNIAVGSSASATGSGSAQDSIGIGANCATGFTQVICLGSSATATAANQFVIGSTTAPVNDMYIGRGVTAAAPSTITINATGGNGSGINGAALNLNGGKGGVAADSGGGVSIRTAATGSATTLADRITVSNNGNITFTQAVQTTGSPTAFKTTPGAHTTLTASAEAVDLDFALNRTVQFSTGALTTQRAAVFRAPTYGFVGASTLTNAATVAITGAPAAGTNATITNPWALWVQAGQTRLDGGASVTGDVLPSADNTYNVGSPALRWALVRATVVTTGDLNMQSDDGTASWTLIEKPDRLVAINRITGKKYKFVFEEDDVDD